MKKEELRMKNCRVADAAKLRKRCAPEDGGRTRARVVCVPVGTRHTHTGIINNTSSYHAQAHAHARRPFSEAEISAWRERIFANSSEDPVRVAVAEAVKDLAEIIAATKPDPYATKRIYAARDWEHDEKIWEITEKRREKRDEKRRNRAIKRVRDVLGDAYAEVLRAYLNHLSWRDIGIPKRTFGDRLKKVKIFFGA